MQFLDGLPSWLAREDSSHEILTSLYLRDALGVSDPSSLPRLLGTGLPPAPSASDAVTAAWRHEWVTALDEADRPEAEPVSADAVAEYRHAADPFLTDAQTWAEVVHADYNLGAVRRSQRDDEPFVLGTLVAEHEERLGRRAHPFRLRIEVLPLTASGIWWIGRSSIAVDELLIDDDAAYRQALEPVVARLA
ncbi:MAG: hypothetical protein ABW040_05295 [Microbacteriaceae bacterium]